MKLPEKITLCEVGLRDGLQNEKICLSAEQKLELLSDIADAGFKVIEVGSFVHPIKMPTMANTDEVFAALPQKEGIEYRAMTPNMRAIERAAACGCKKGRISVSASRAHNLANFNRTPQEMISTFADLVEKANASGIELAGSIQMTFGSPWAETITYEDIAPLVKTYVDLGITEILLNDTAGVAFPKQVYEYCCKLQEAFPEIKRWGLHLHNTRGLGIANTLAGMEAGILYHDAAFAGTGGCPFVPGAAGNTATEDVLHLLDGIGVETGVDIDKVIAIGKKVNRWLGHESDSYILRAGKASDLIREIPTGQKRFK